MRVYPSHDPAPEEIVSRDMSWLDTFELSTRSYNCLRLSTDAREPLDIIRASDKELLLIPNFGRTCLRELREVFRPPQPPRISRAMLLARLSGLQEQIEDIKDLIRQDDAR
jgi:hypothetical protein